MGSSNTLRALGYAAQAGGNYFSTIHAESMRTKRLADARAASESDYKRNRADTLADKGALREYNTAQEKKAAITAAALAESKAAKKAGILSVKDEKDAADLLAEQEREDSLLTAEQEREDSLLIAEQEREDGITAAENKVAAEKEEYKRGLVLTEDEQIAKKQRMQIADEALEKNSGILTAADGAGDKIDRYDRILKLLETEETGYGEGFQLEAQKALKMFGVNTDGKAIANSEELMVLLGDEVMGRVAETKGAVSEKEMALFEQYSANYEKSNAGNRQIIMFKKAQNERLVALSTEIRAWRKEGLTSIEIDEKRVAYLKADENDLSSFIEGAMGMSGEAQSGNTLVKGSLSAEDEARLAKFRERAEGGRHAAYQ